MQWEFLHHPFFFWPLVSFAAVVLLAPILMRVAPVIGLVDQPGGRKKHDGAIPLIGGISIFSVFIVVSFAGGYEGEYWPLYAGLGLLLLTGAIDDAIHLHAFIKFGVQFIAAGLLVFFGDVQILGLGNLFGLGDFWLDFMVYPFSIVSIVLLINAVNLMDGLDGLAGGISFVMCGWMMLAAVASGSDLGLSIALLMAAIAGFLIYNIRAPWRAKAAAFLGDAGSMCLGLMLGYYAISLAPHGVDSSLGAVAMEPMVVAWILAVPIWDECAQFYRRVSEGRHPFSPDRGHIHHNFIQAGFSDAMAVYAILGLVFVSGAFGVLGYSVGIPLPILTIIWIVGILVHMRLARNLNTYPAIIKKLTARKTVSPQ